MEEIAKNCIEIGIIKELYEKKLISKQEMELAINELKNKKGA